MKTRAFTVCAMICLQASAAWSAIPQRDRRLYDLRSTQIPKMTPSTHNLQLGCVRDFSKGLNMAMIMPVTERALFTKEDVSLLIPSNMAATDNEGMVAAQILDRAFNSVLKSDTVRGSDIGRTATLLNDSMSSDMSFGGDEPNTTKHKVKFSLRATETVAKLEYKGFTNAQVSYSIGQEKMNIEIREPMKLFDTQLVINHISSRDDSRQMASLRWAW